MPSVDGVTVTCPMTWFGHRPAGEEPQQVRPEAVRRNWIGGGGLNCGGRSRIRTPISASSLSRGWRNGLASLPREDGAAPGG